MTTVMERPDLDAVDDEVDVVVPRPMRGKTVDELASAAGVGGGGVGVGVADLYPVDRDHGLVRVRGGRLSVLRW